MMRLLFTCMGTSDPVRGYHDGPMLHIIRHYRPEVICVFLSGEAAALDGCGARLDTVLSHIQNNWGGYAPELRVVRTQIDDPSDMDAVGAPITEAVAALTEEFPDGEVLLNLSSGTPQMKIALAFLAADLRRSMRGIQVKNFERASGTTERTNAPDYSVADELECNEDEAPDAPNRCSEPELMHMQRQRAKEQLLTLLDVRDYSAIYTMKNLPNQLKALIGHLDARDQMQSEAARNFAQNLKLPFSLYPVRTGAPRSDYAEVSEAYLVLLNRSHRQQYEEMILRLNPLVVRLELQLMKTVLAGKNLRLEDVIDRPYSRRPRFVPDMLAEKLPDVYQSVCTDFGAPLRESDVSMEVCYRILEHLPDVPVDAMPVLKSCNLLNESCRNSLAHQLTAVTAEQITAACGMQPAQLLNQVGKLIAAIYPECDPALFTIYKRCGDYIKSKIL